MAMVRYSVLGAGALCALLAVAGCNSSGSPQNGEPPNSPQGRAAAPLVLHLRGPDPIPQAGDIRLDLDIVVNDGFQMPVVLNVRVPQGAALVSGLATEQLSLPHPGKLVRTYIVRTSGPLAAPVQVTADSQHPSGISGIHAERYFPPPAAPAYGQPGVRPPVGRPPGPPR